jgi:hypothetical protein
MDTRGIGFLHTPADSSRERDVEKVRIRAAFYPVNDPFREPLETDLPMMGEGYITREK